MAPEGASRILEWGVAGAPRAGQTTSGDVPLVQIRPGGALVAAIDGIGSGEEAAAAARVAEATLRRHARDPLLSLVRRCHEALRGTRGATMSLASFDGATDTMSWIGIGNVEGLLLRADPGTDPPKQAIIQRGGALGYSLPPLKESVLRVTPGDLLIFATDGIRSEFSGGLERTKAPQLLADEILAGHALGTDDALVLVAKYLNTHSPS